MSNAEEASLITEAQNGSVQAFERLYRHHVGRVHGLCLRLCGEAADAQDATQETFIKAWKALSGFHGNSAFSTWLHRIAFNQVMSMKRKNGNNERHLHAVDEAASSRASSLTEVEQLERALADLPARAREAIVLNKVYGYTHEETAEFMGTTVGASKSQVHRAIQLLRVALPGYEHGDEDSAATQGGERP